MSFRKLPTELDAKIASHLVGDTQSLSALSKVSRYYRTVAEPYLYEEVEFNDMEMWHLWCLLRTMIDRNTVASYVKRVMLCDIMGPQRKKMARPDEYKRQNEEKMCTEIWARVGQIMGHINLTLVPIMNSSAAAKFAYGLTGDLFSEFWDESLVALVLIFANNLEALELHVEFSSHKTIRDLLQLPPSGANPPLQKLKTLSMNDLQGKLKLNRSNLHSLQHLSLKSWNSGDGLVADFLTLTALLPSGSNPMLTDLHLRENKLTPEKLQVIASSPASINVKKLRLVDYRWEPIVYGSDWNFNGFINVLDKYLPNLEGLAWIGY